MEREEMEKKIIDLELNIALMERERKDQKEMLTKIYSVLEDVKYKITGNGDYRNGIIYKVDCNTRDIELLKSNPTYDQMKEAFEAGKTALKVIKFLFGTKIGQTISLLGIIVTLLGPSGVAYLFFK